MGSSEGTRWGHPGARRSPLSSLYTPIPGAHISRSEREVLQIRISFVGPPTADRRACEARRPGRPAHTHSQFS